ncbi:hypothetical protein I4U23_022132 [Adineta vaga]|nr:hypothetical protein I4U23_022132 [Adineta vaga]
MEHNREDLIIRFRVEPTNRYNGIRLAFLENYLGISRDEHKFIWQFYLLFDNAQTYPSGFPLTLIRIIVKIGVIIRRILGFKH